MNNENKIDTIYNWQSEKGFKFVLANEPTDEGKEVLKQLNFLQLNYKNNIYRSLWECSFCKNSSLVYDLKKRKFFCEEVTCQKSGTFEYFKNILIQNGIIQRPKSSTLKEVYVSYEDRVKARLSKEWDFRLNMILGCVEFKRVEEKHFKQIKDRDVNSICHKIKEEKEFARLSVNKVHEILDSEFTPEYNPIQEYFDRLPEWDGTDFLSQLSDRIEAEEEIIDSETKTLYLKRWLIGVIAKGYAHQKHDQMLILTGPQGVGKSSFFQRIFPGIDKSGNFSNPYYANKPEFDPSDKDSKILLTNSLLINLDEMSSFNKKDIAKVKGLITQDTVTVRKPYARRAETLPAIASFCGSTNENDFLSDLTGSRRFLTIPVKSIDYENINTEFIQGVWTQAFALFKQGEKHYFSEDEIKKIDELNASYQAVSPEVEAIQDYFIESETSTMNATEILGYLNEITLDKKLKFSIQAIGKALSSLGYKKKSVRTPRGPQKQYKIDIKPEYRNKVTIYHSLE